MVARENKRMELVLTVGSRPSPRWQGKNRFAYGVETIPLQCGEWEKLKCHARDENNPIGTVLVERER